MNHTFSTPAAKTVDHLAQELQSIRTGRANPELVESLVVEAYGTPTPLVQLAAISVPEPRMILIQAWDPSINKDIERAISKSPLGITAVVDGKSIRLPFPAMTEDRRHAMQKVVNEKGEEARVSIRTIREDIIKHLRQQEKDGKLSEDQLALELKHLQELVSTTLSDIETAVKTKTEELAVI